MTTIDLLNRIDHKLDPTLSERLVEVDEARKVLRAAKERFAAAKESAQMACAHKIIIEDKGGSGYSAGGRRVCYFCGLYELQLISDPGDEYNYASYGSYKILTGSQYHYSSDEGREVYSVDRTEFNKTRWTE